MAIGEAPDITQARARSKFPLNVAQSKISPRNRDTSLPMLGEFIILDVETFSTKELRLLDDVDEELNSGVIDEQNVKVFDVVNFKSMNSSGQTRCAKKRSKTRHPVALTERRP